MDGLKVHLDKFGGNAPEWSSYYFKLSTIFNSDFSTEWYHDINDEHVQYDININSIPTKEHIDTNSIRSPKTKAKLVKWVAVIKIGRASCRERV